MTDITPLRNAWENEGSHPQYHHIMQYKLRDEWPVLYYAILEVLNNES